MRSEKQHNYGVDLLKIIGMLMIVNIHVISYGGAMRNAQIGTGHYYIVWFFRTLCYVSANVYGLITGYLMYGSSCQYRKLIPRYLQVIFYTVLFTIVLGTPTAKSILMALLPVNLQHYWYITMYFGVCIFAPLLSHAVRSMKMKELLLVLFGMLVMFSVLPTLVNEDPYLMGRGYSVMWLAVLFVFGAVIRKYRLETRFRGKHLLLAFAICIIGTLSVKLVWAWRFYLKHGDVPYSKGDWILQLNSPTILCAAVCLMLLFLKYQVSGARLKRWLPRAANATLGVYLIHMNYGMISYITGVLEPYLQAHPMVFLGMILGETGAIFLVCTLIEMLREWLFGCLKVQRLAELSVYDRIRDKLLGKITGYLQLEEETSVQN